ncbi:hypothetical protein [Spirosoma arcticum]
MHINYFNAAQISNLKATVHNTGRMGFSRNAEKQLNLQNVKSFRIGSADNYQESKILLLVPVQSKEPEYFTVAKSGPYYYLNAKSLMDVLNEDYQTEKIVYDILVDSAEGKPIFKLKRRTVERKR